MYSLKEFEMAGEDTQILANGTPEVLTIIPSSEKLTNGNGLLCTKHNNNGSIPNGKVLDIVAGENGKLFVPNDEEFNSLHAEFDEADVSCGWGPCKPHWLQFFATKQAFLVTFCITWVSTHLIIVCIEKSIFYRLRRYSSRAMQAKNCLFLFNNKCAWADFFITPCKKLLLPVFLRCCRSKNSVAMIKIVLYIFLINI